MLKTALIINMLLWHYGDINAGDASGDAAFFGGMTIEEFRRLDDALCTRLFSAIRHQIDNETLDS
jgi:hypothetical protein